MDELRFAIVGFSRVFDTTPAAEVLNLGELLELFRWFEVKAETTAAVEREVSRIARALDSVRSTGRADGPVGLQLTRAAAAGEAALVAAAAHLTDEARRAAKRDLRTWSPALYKPGAVRGAEGVLSLSAVVFDYDRDTSLAELSDCWEPWFHVVHSTWSHRADRPRFRVVLPLARPVAAADWAAVWAWGAERADHAVDPALKGVAAMFALPALPSRDAALVAEIRPGALLDPEVEGVALRPPPLLPPLGRSALGPSHRDPKHSWVNVDR